MNIKGWRALIKLSENGCDFGIHKQLEISRSVLLNYIDEMEKETGLTLIKRKKQHNTLTNEAIGFIPYAQKIVEAFEKTSQTRENKLTKK